MTYSPWQHGVVAHHGDGLQEFIAPHLYLRAASECGCNAGHSVAFLLLYIASSQVLLVCKRCERHL